MRMKEFTRAVASVLAMVPLAASAQLSITTNTAQTQDFNALATSGTANAATGGIFAQGWSFLESGSNSNLTYAAGTGSDNAGNTYSYGVSGNNPASDRAFGVLQSGSLTSILGFAFTNNTGVPVNRIAVGYTGENWRRAAAVDTLTFSYQAGTPSLNATSGWTAVSTLNYSTVLTGTATALDGNASANRTVISPVNINGVSIVNGGSLTMRWVDQTASSSAGLSIDDFSITLLTVRGNHWVGDDTTLGGAGTWSQDSGSSWAQSNADALGYFWDPTKTATFGGVTGGAVTVSGTVPANAGILFTASGYSLTGGTVTLGAASPAGNSIEVDTTASSASIETVLSGTNGLSKTGGGTLVLSSTNTYSGATNVAAGTLSLATTASITSNVTVASGATLIANGNITGDVTVIGSMSGDALVTGTVTVSGSLSPGNSPGLMVVGGLSLANGSSTTMEIAADSSHDEIDVAGAIVYDGALSIPIAGTHTAGESFQLFGDFTSYSGDFDSITLAGSYNGALVNSGGTWSALLGGLVFTFTSSDGVLSLSTAAIPEPLTAAGVLLLSGRVMGRRSRTLL